MLIFGLQPASGSWHSWGMATMTLTKKNPAALALGRLGALKGVLATVLAVDTKGMTVQFDDRADTSRIAFSDRGWMDFIEVAS